MSLNKNRLVGDIINVLHFANQIIRERIDVKNFSEFAIQYNRVYRQLQEHREELIIDNELLKLKIDDLTSFKERHKPIGGGFLFVRYFFKLFQESKDVEKVRHIHSTLSVIKMLLENG